MTTKRAQKRKSVEFGRPVKSLAGGGFHSSAALASKLWVQIPSISDFS